MLKKVSNVVKKGDFVKNVLTLITGTTIAQAIPIAISPILTRLYTPEEFGVFALYFSIVSIIAIFATGRYEQAIMLPVKDRDASNIVMLAMIITTTVSIFTLIFLIVLDVFFLKYMPQSEVYRLLYLIPISIMLTGYYQTLNYWLNRRKKYKTIMSNRVWQSTTTGLLNIGFGKFPIIPNGLVISSVFAQFIATSRYMFIIFNKKDIQLNQIDKHTIISQAKKYKDFPKFSTFANGTETLTSNLPNILFTTLYSSTIVGFYSLARRVIGIPISVVGGAIGDVFFQRASEEYKKNGECNKLYVNTFLVLVAISVIPFILLFIYSPILFSYVFGEEWEIAGLYCRYLTVPFFLQFITSPLSNMFIIAEKQKLELKVQIIVLILTVTSIIIGYACFDSAKATIILFSIALSMKYLLFLVFGYIFSINRKQKVTS